MNKFFKSFWTMLGTIILVLLLLVILWGTMFSYIILAFLGLSFGVFILARKIEMYYWEVKIINIFGIILSIFGIIVVILKSYKYSLT